MGQYVIVFPDLNLITIRLGELKGKRINDDPYTEDIYVYMDAALEIAGYATKDKSWLCIVSIHRNGSTIWTFWLTVSNRTAVVQRQNSLLKKRRRIQRIFLRKGGYLGWIWKNQFEMTYKIGINIKGMGRSYE